MHSLAKFLRSLPLGLLVTSLVCACRPQPIVILAGETQSRTVDNHSEPALPTLSVQGLATLEVAPDRLDLHILLREEAARPDRAVAAMQKRQAAFEEAIRDSKLSKVERTLGQLSVAEHREYIDNKEVKVGYQASIRLTISMTDFDKVGVFMQLAAEHGAESMNTQFRCTKLSDMKMKVRAEAVQAAKQKAEQLSQLSGTQLGVVISLSEGDHQDAYWGATSIANSYTPAVAREALSQGDSQKLSINVTITYRLLAG